MYFQPIYESVLFHGAFAIIALLVLTIMGHFIVGIFAVCATIAYLVVKVVYDYIDLDDEQYENFDC